MTPSEAYARLDSLLGLLNWTTAQGFYRGPRPFHESVLSDMRFGVGTVRNL